MLVLSRKKDEKFLIETPSGEVITITIVRIDGLNKVRIGIEADKNVSVLRSELTCGEQLAAYPQVKRK
jgi:carbon storage regulator CsrA